MKTFSIRLHDELKPLYVDLMNNCGSFCDEYTRNTGIDVVSFVAQWGKLFPIEENSGILFVGRATRGWANDDRNVDNLFDDPKDKIFNREDQMIWAHDYQSPFWRVLRGIANNIYGKDGIEHVAWTNVSKLAPDSNNGNPIGELYNIQQNDDYRIFLKEVELFSPKVIVLFTGVGWGWDYLCTINNNGDPQDGQILSEYEWSGYKTKVYRIDKKIVVLSEHPQTRPEQEHIECITQIIFKYTQKL